ncbi:MAG: zinc ABC transporter substrate-binding protein [Alistipes sp.]|nr:zinc ABC transporter substrate-binding protein [Alistipes sp.]
MKKYGINLLSIFSIVISLCGTGACTSQSAQQETIYVSILPLRGLVHEIVGEDLPIEVLVPAGASPETFEPTPRQFIALNQARLVMNVGLLDFEAALLEKIEDRKKIVNLNKNIKLIAGTCSHAKHSEHKEHHHAHGIDPHIWTSPKALLQMAENAYEAIRYTYPDSVKYEINYRKLKQILEDLDSTVTRKIETSGVRTIVIYHPALTYYARDYGLQQIAIEEDGKEPSARHLARLIETAREGDVRNIFFQSQFPASVVEVIANDIGAKAIQIDPLCENAIGNIEMITDLITAQ